MTAPPLTDPYAILGVTAEASDDDLDHAFRILVRQLHPDTRTSTEPDADADLRLQQLLTAYTTLRDPIRRAAYDRTRARPASTKGASTLRPRFPSAPQTPVPIRFGSAIRVGPVHWEP
ncbi:MULTISPECIES: J domain-containing protein [unclassified Kribbella]|uniref:J domain-containing protein n=1 Tax=unclassified Kribbella TaxID=2644121 RepID=UPI00301692E7